jgi:TonB family protein
LSNQTVIFVVKLIQFTFFKPSFSMKYLSIFCLLMVQNLFGQTIDCASLEKMQGEKLKLNPTMRSQSIITTKYGDTETMMEMDAAKNIRSISKMPKMGGASQRETEGILIQGIIYTKTKEENVWYYKAIPLKDSAKMAENFKNFMKGQNCKIVGTETIDGRLLTIVESTILMKQVADAPTVFRTWFDPKDSVIKKSVMEQNFKQGMYMKMVTEYGIAVTPIEKPLNAIPDSLKPKPQAPKHISGAYSDRSQMSTGSRPERNPEYKDGQKALFTFLNNNLVYPKAAKDAKFEGTVYVRFFVETDGVIKDLQVARGIGSGCDEAAIEVIKKTSGNWRCGTEADKPVRTQFTLPIQFRLKNISVKD